MSLFKQQRLPAWQPLLTPFCMAICFLVVAVVFIPMGGFLTYTSTKAIQYSFRYDHIKQCTTHHNEGYFEYSGDGTTQRNGCFTKVMFTIDKRMSAPIYLYYGLTEFYQNHRRYSESLSPRQLSGKPIRAHLISGVSPLLFPGQLHGTGTTRMLLDGKAYHYSDFVYAPVGLIPWSMFNDTFTLFYLPNASSTTSNGEHLYSRMLICNGSAFSRYTNLPLPTPPGKMINRCRKKGIAWKTDTSVKYRAPHFPSSPKDKATPVWSAPKGSYSNWNASIPVPMSNDSYYNNGWYAGELGHAIPVTTDEDFIVWSRVATFPKFRKLYRIIEMDLEPGSYVMEIEEHFDSVSFGGTKSFTLTTLTWMGGRNMVLPGILLGVGVTGFVCVIVFMLLSRIYPTRAEKAIAFLSKS